MNGLILLRLWISVSAICVATGWALSFAGKLNELGFLAGGILCVFTTLCFLRGASFRWRPLIRRFRRPLPFIFLLLAGLSFVGGILYPPTNYDGLSYRLPRVLNWLAEGNWHWIDSVDPRMNDRTCGFEWLMAPLISLTKSHRACFLINWISFLLLPGLAFGFFVKVGVSPRVAWFWMWLLASGYNFVIQSGSIANDAFAAVYALAAVYFALRSHSSRKDLDLWYSLLAAGLLTGSKIGNLPLLLPWLLAILPQARLLLVRPIVSLVISLISLLISFFPIALANWWHGGDWTGAKFEPQLVMKSPAVGMLGNSFFALLQNVLPPVFPFAGWWNSHAPTLLPGSFFKLCESNFEGGYYRLGELQIEEAAGVGFAITALLLISLLSRCKRTSKKTENLWVKIVRWSSLISLLVFFAKSGMIEIARLISPYYPFLFAVFLVAQGQEIVRRRWWRTLAVLAMLSSIVVVVLTPARPLWPASQILACFGQNHPLIVRAGSVYRVYEARRDLFASLRKLIPADIHRVGLACDINDAQTALWQPFGTRRLVNLTGDNLSADVGNAKVKWLIIKKSVLEGRYHISLIEFLEKRQATLVGSEKITELVRVGPEDWLVVSL